MAQGRGRGWLGGHARGAGRSGRGRETGRQWRGKDRGREGRARAQGSPVGERSPLRSARSSARPGWAGTLLSLSALCSSRSGYDGHSDLHVGITNSQGMVYHYDQEGVHRSASGWEQCICIPLVQPDMWELLQLWDNLLEEFSWEEAWLPHRYDEQQHNCFTFALAFVNRVRHGRGREPLSKAHFTESFLLPHTREASRYLTLHQQLAHTDVYIVPLAEQEQDSVAANHSLLE
ncbi:PREDICTED: MKRN2 opposite strand protein [Ficedula albicollis]|uniref:MKRN2 opposite strand protein n=1 Tax=Ficedula albicollis TaxID=59894 RepID=UPI0003598AA4|nr:PREDICTED: MKRN2 opposite strand protein [Ficedula albicollis]